METDAAFLLRVLSDGRPHSLNEILQASFAERGCGMTVHSRVSDLRSQGYTIDHVTIPGAKRGAGHAYRLVFAEPVFACSIDESAGMAEQLGLL